MKSEQERIQYVSVLRVCSMLLIVLYHSMCYYTGTWWYLCTDIVPLWKLLSPPTVTIGLTTFVFISGFLYGYLYMKQEIQKCGAIPNKQIQALVDTVFLLGNINGSFSTRSSCFMDKPLHRYCASLVLTDAF